MSEQSKVKCQCCGMMMVPAVTRTKGVFVGWQWGWRYGAGEVNGSVCPFCMSENWDDATKPVHRPISQKFKLLAVVALAASLAYGVFTYVGTDLLGLEFGRLFQTIAEWSFVILAIAFYRRYRVTRSK